MEVHISLCVRVPSCLVNRTALWRLPNHDANQYAPPHKFREPRRDAMALVLRDAPLGFVYRDAFVPGLTGQRNNSRAQFGR